MPQQATTPSDKLQSSAVVAARYAIDVASDKQASDIVLLDISAVSAFADYMVIMTAASARQVNALAEDITKAIGKQLALHHREGTAESGWVLLDFADLVVHIFTPTQRDFYRLERVWSKGKALVRVQ